MTPVQAQPCYCFPSRGWLPASGGGQEDYSVTAALAGEILRFGPPEGPPFFTTTVWEHVIPAAQQASQECVTAPFTPSVQQVLSSCPEARKNEVTWTTGG